MVNEAAVVLTGISRDFLVGMPLKSLLPAVEGVDLSNSQSPRESHRAEGALAAADGRRIPVSLSIARMTDTSTKTVGFVCLVHDLTERRELEQRLLLDR